jgi:transcriptional regulator with XRE-family HTH domain
MLIASIEHPGRAGDPATTVCSTFVAHLVHRQPGSWLHSEREEGAPVAAVRVWTGREARALRGALRLSVRGFGEHLGVAPRTVSKWEHLGEDTRPHPDTQAILDTALGRAGTDVQLRFQLLLDGEPSRPSWATSAAPAWDYEEWADDLDRAVVALSRQDFAACAWLTDRWLIRHPAARLDARGLYLHARSLVLAGDAHRDQGRLSGPQSAACNYRQALAVYGELDIPCRIAQLELSLTVVTEMGGELAAAARGYARLAGDERLGGRDRARARLWIGTALSKDGQHDYAARVMTEAGREFEDLGVTEDWSVAQQKLALAHRGAGNLAEAQRLIGMASASGTAGTPLQKVRLSTAQAHILLTDTGTRAQGLALLDDTAQLAERCGLSHQLRAIESIRLQALAHTR